jgi:hypothetical protein
MPTAAMGSEEVMTTMPGAGRGRGGVAAVRRKREDEPDVGSPVKRARSIALSSPEPIDPRLAGPVHDEELVGSVPGGVGGVGDGRVGGVTGCGDGAGNAVSNILFNTPVYNSHQALLTLVEAAGKDTPLPTSEVKSSSPGSDTEGDGDGSEHRHHHHHHHHHHPHHHQQSPPVRGGGGVRFSSIPTDGSINNNNTSGGGSFASSHTHLRNSTTSPPMGPARSLSISTGTNHEPEGIDKALRMWNKFRFVKAGWFTAREAIDYVE